MQQTISLDSRFPVPDSLNTSDPIHPLQLVRSATMLQQQAAENAKYDPPTPARFAPRRTSEGFQTINLDSQWIGPLLLLAFVIVVSAMALKSLGPVYSILFGATVFGMYYIKIRSG